jgi:hypothetical protein
MKKELNAPELKNLVAKGKKRGFLTEREIVDALQDVDLTPDQIEEPSCGFRPANFRYATRGEQGISLHAIEEARLSFHARPARRITPASSEDHDGVTPDNGFLSQHRVGGGIAPADLPHHRAYGSVPRRFM